MQTIPSRFDTQSQAGYFLSLPLEIRAARWSQLTEDEQEALAYEWDFWARPEQLLPPGTWTYWLMKAGRGWGKTRSGAECVRAWVRQRAARYVNLIAPTADDARDVMVEGESGILAICPRGERPIYVPSKRRLEWPNGCRSLIFSADEPERLRGKQHGKLWADELAAWRYPESWDQAMFGLRLGANPQAVVTTTPRPTPLIKELMKHPGCIVTGGGSYENRDNLADAFFATIVKKYEGTRLGRQELNAELLDDNPGALWQRKQIDATRVAVAPELRRVVTAVDPAVTSREDSDETGIIGAGSAPAPQGWQGVDGDHYYVIADASLIASPEKWARAAVKSYHDHKADRLVAETNNGGEMVELTIRTIDQNVSYKSVTASRGKMIRAEPIAALYEQGRVHHVGSFAKLEDQMCDYDPLTSPFSPDRMDALVWALTELSDDTDMGVFNYYRQLAGKQAAQTLVAPLPSSTTRTAPGWPA
jgi:phage terminase large subunit-like protein